jgi:nitrogen regulatory protein P-II 1
MKKIEAVIEPFKLDEVKRVLEGEDIQRITIFEVHGAGRAQGKLKQYRGIEYVEDALQIKVEAIVDDDEAEHVADAILNALRTGDLGDGEVATLPVEKVARLRVGQRRHSPSNRHEEASSTYLMKNKASLKSRLKTLTRRKPEDVASEFK